jgi:hypothetical protein
MHLINPEHCWSLSAATPSKREFDIGQKLLESRHHGTSRTEAQLKPWRGLITGPQLKDMQSEQGVQWSQRYMCKTMW